MSKDASVEWSGADGSHRARWRSEAGVPPPRRIQVVNDTLKADAALRLASEGTAMVWQGDFHNARQLLQALGRRIDRKASGDGHSRDPRGSRKERKDPPVAISLLEAFHHHRQAQGQRARLLGRLLVPLEGDYGISLPRAPDIRSACREAWGDSDGEPSLVSLRELLGLVGAHEWRKKGVAIPALGEPPHNRIHPHYGVFSPVRGEYLDLIARAPLPSIELAFDVGTGTGVIAAVLARRGVRRIVATDQDQRAITCASENLARLQLQDRVQVVCADLFPAGMAPLVVCNPPWLPARPSAPLEHAIYDEDSRMLRGFLAGLPAHLAPGGEGWLVLSDLAEHLGLRQQGDLQAWIASAGLRVIARDGIAPRHPKATDASDPLHPARAKETTFLWRLGVQ